MSVDLELAPKQKRAAGERCCDPVVYPDVQREHAVRMATVAKALGDPIRLQLVDVLRSHAGKVCVCELVPLFDVAQPTLSHHLNKLRAAGIVDSERRGLWAYYYVIPDALEELSAWLSWRLELDATPLVETGGNGARLSVRERLREAASWNLVASELEIAGSQARKAGHPATLCGRS